MKKSWNEVVAQPTSNTPTQPDINLYNVANDKAALCCACARKLRKKKTVELLETLDDDLCEKCGAGEVVGAGGE